MNQDAINVRRDAAVMTHEQIATKLGISKGRVFQIEQSALKKLRRRLARFVEGNSEP